MAHFDIQLRPGWKAVLKLTFKNEGDINPAWVEEKYSICYPERLMTSSKRVDDDLI